MAVHECQQSSSGSEAMCNELERGREHYAQRAWAEAFEALSRADQQVALSCEDLELLAMSAYLVGRDDDYLRALERAYRAHLQARHEVRAARTAFWLGLRLMFRGEAGHASGWFARAQRLLDRTDQEHVERGYLLLVVVEQQRAAGDCASAYASAQAAADIGERFGESELVAIARHLQGHVRIEQGQVERALALFDEAMLAVTTDELSPLATGLVYCGVIEGCQRVYALSRAREWTSALSHWCEQQPEMIAFTGLCRVHRSEILQLHGAWSEAFEEAQRAGERCREVNRQAAGAALYQEAEVHRLRGDFDAAEVAYRAAYQSGRDPQPGMALLRAAQGRLAAATAAIRRVTDASTDRWERAKLLPAYVEIMLRAGDVSAARRGCEELEQIAASAGADVLLALAAQARGALELALGNARSALDSLRRCLRVWQQIDAPYPAARARVSMAHCCRMLRDDDASRLELDEARRVFEQLGALPDLAAMDALVQGSPSRRRHGLTARELEVLRLVARGKTNKAIASELFLSEKTVERHVSNIFHKLHVPSRAAATAYAYEHELI